MSTKPSVLQRNFLPADLAAHQSATPLPLAGSVCVQADIAARASVVGGTALATYDSRRHALQSKES